MKINTTCPKCGAPHARKLSVIYSEGIISVNTTAIARTQSTAILKIKHNTKSEASGLQQSDISKNAAPPLSSVGIMKTASDARAGIIGFIGFIGMGLIGFFVSKSFLGFVGYFLGGGLLAVLLAYSIFDSGATDEEKRNHQNKIDEFQLKLMNWECTYMCNHCGERFIPESL